MSEFQAAANDYTVATEAIKIFTSTQVRSELVVKNRTVASGTLFVSSPSVSLNRASTLTASSQDVSDHSEAKFSNAGQAASSDVLDPVCRNRTMLLVRKYVGNSSVEDNARFEILTQRLRNLDPRVTTEQFTALDSMVDRLEARSAEMDEIDGLLEHL